jgi:fructosamine-3-kinase
MSEFVERVINRSLGKQDISNNYSRLSGGISNETYRVPTLIDGLTTDLAVTIIKDPASWWKIEQEYSFRKALEGDPEVRIPKLYNAGFDNLDDHKFAFIIREFLAGQDLDIVFASRLATSSPEINAMSLATDLGKRLAVLHRHETSVFGLVGREHEVIYSGWGNYVLGEIEEKSRLLAELPSDGQIGSIRVGDIVNLLPDLHRSIGSLEWSLLGQKSSLLSHGDAHFRNFIANSDENSTWHINGMIDTEEALGGDPEIDIAFIENWLHFVPYGQRFYQHKGDFLAGYKGVREISDHYLSRRLIYHALRSLSYLQAVSTFDQDKFMNMDSKNLGYASKHFSILKSLAMGNALEDLKILSLV